MHSHRLVVSHILLRVFLIIFLHLQSLDEMHTLFSTILEFYVNNPSIPPHLLNSVVDILGALIIILPEEGHQCIGSFPPFLSSPDRLFYLCQQGTIKADVFIQICASLPSLSKRLANYFSAPFHDESRLGCISQEAFDTKWIDFRQTSFQYVDAILASLQLEQLLAIPALFQGRLPDAVELVPAEPQRVAGRLLRRLLLRGGGEGADRRQHATVGNECASHE